MHSNKTIVIASDHAGFTLKQSLITYLTSQNILIKDQGPYSTESVDYPDFVCKLVTDFDLNNQIGILICGSGIGVSIAANRYPNIRAALCYEKQTTYLARNHNNANVLCLGARFTDKKTAEELVDVFINTEFSDEKKHHKRVEKIEKTK